MLTQGERRPWAAIVVVATCVAIGLAACSPSDQPSPSPTTVGSHPTPTSTPRPTPTTPQAPVLPDQEESEDGAVAMMRYVFELYSYVFASNDATALSSISSKDCTFCKNVVQSAANNGSAGFHVVGGELQLTNPYALSIGDDGYFSGRGDVVQQASRTVDASGATVDEGSERHLTVHVALQWSDERWTLLEVGTKPNGAP